ncbi:MAG TPA: efflux RND transporter permease subunit, partial [Woeseiaceae bacterium]
MFEGVIRHGTILAVAVLVICVLGTLAALRIPVQMIPDLDVRVISVQTRWPGATPQDVEKEILIEQEEYLRTIPNLERMVSTASGEEATVELEFPFGTDINEALIRVNNALSQVPSYPENVDEPRLRASSFSQNSFMYFRVVPLEGNPFELDMTLMRDFVDDNVRTRMERVDGVSQVNIGGGAERQVRIRVDPGKLAERGITLTEVRNAIRSRNSDASAGDLDTGKRRYLLRTVGRFTDLEDMEQVIIAQRGTSLIRLVDVASIELTHFELRNQSLFNGKPSLNLSVDREPGSNVIAIKEALLPVMDEINAQVLNPSGMQMYLNTDDARYVQDSVANVWQNLAIGAGLATLVMYLFLRSARATLVGVIGIPICTIAAFIGLMAAGRTINVISLAGVAFAIGMTLDNSIVVLEAIERRRREGAERIAAALEGVRQVWPAVLASTMTTILVFAPIFFIEQEAGQLYSDVAVAISASILVSMLIAVSVVPSLSARLKFGVRGDTEAAGAGFRQKIVDGVGWLVSTTRRRVVTIAGVVGGVTLVLLLLTPPGEYLPEGEEAKLFSSMIAPPGYNLAEMSALAEQVQEHFMPYVEDDPERFARGEVPVPAMRSLNLSVSPENVRMIVETVDPGQINDLMTVV